MFSNWRTTAWAVLSVLTIIAKHLNPDWADALGEVTDVLLGGGLIAAADATRGKLSASGRALGVGLFVMLLSLPAPAVAFDVLVTGTELRFDYTEPTANSDGSPLADLGETRIYFQREGGSPVLGATIPATRPQGGGHVEGALTVPVLQDQESNVTFWATARDATGNESAPSPILARRIDRLAPGAPH